MFYNKSIMLMCKRMVSVLAIIVAICSFTNAEPAAQNKTATPKSDVSKIKSSATKIIVYYFHGNIRCPACIDLENFTKSEVEFKFADAIKTGKIVWQVINYDEKGNEHYLDDYKLYAQSVVISTVTDGKETSWKNLGRVWQLVQDEWKFRAYIKSEVAACLMGKCL